MKIEIPLDVIQATTHCPKQFACLTQPFATICPVTHAPGEMLFIHGTSAAPCPYRQSIDL